MSANVMRTAIRSKKPTPSNRTISQASLQSLREFRRKRFATRQFPSQPRLISD